MLNKAIIFATNAHADQRRKVDQSAFIIHPLSVGCLLANAGEDEDVIIAGILHDVVEDTDVTMEQIEATFGKQVTSLVAGCTENKALTWEERKQQTMVDLKTASEKICIITCADKIHNLQVSVEGIQKQGEAFFTHFNRGYADQKWYYGTIKNTLETRIPNHPLFHKYKEVYEAAFL